MAILIYKPASGKPTSGVQVQAKDRIYFFEAGQAQYVPKEDVTAVTNALVALGGTVTNGPADL